jgi:D-inositol-3-phosphate glycosyltransferase
LTISLTCTAYAFSQPWFLKEFVTRLLLVPTYPCDSLMTTTEVAKRALTSILDRLKDELERAHGARLASGFEISVIPRGVSVDLFKPRERCEVRRQLQLPLNKTILLYMGRIDPASKSDVIPLLLAFRKVVAKHADHALLLLVGQTSGHTANLLDTIAQMGLGRHVIHRTDLPNVSIPLYYSASDIFVSLSDTLQENFGRTPVEAMASGLPVVVSNWAGYQETVVHDRTGFKVPATWTECDEDLCLLAPFYEWQDDHFYTGQSVAIDIDATAGFLDLLVRDESRRLEMGAAARRHVLENFTLEGCAELMWSLWRGLSEVAEGLSPLSPPQNAIMRPRYFQDFREFASCCLSGSAPIRLTERGRAVTHGKEPLLLIKDDRQLLGPGLLGTILRALRFATFMRHQIKLEDLEMILGKRDIAATVTRRHVMWLLKYGLVRVNDA